MTEARGMPLALVSRSGKGPSQRRRFGRTDLEVSPFGFGCARIGGIFQRDAADYLKLLSAALDAGINFFDTADIYSQGESESLLGRALRGHRDEVILASKAGYVLPVQRRMVARIKPLVRPLLRLVGLRRRHLPGAVRGSPVQDFSPAHLRRALEGSLRRLGTDFLDLFQLHSPPAEVVQRGEWLDAVHRFKEEGKIRYYGISCDSPAAAAAALRYPTLSAIHVSLSLLEQRALAVIAKAKEQEVAVIARECLANGLLVKDASEVDLSSHCQSAEEIQTKGAQLQSYRAQAAAAGCTLAELALRFVSSQPGVTVSLIGASNLQQLQALSRTGIFGG